MGERLLRELQLEAQGSVPEWRDLLLVERHQSTGGEMAGPCATPRMSRVQITGQAILAIGVRALSERALAFRESPFAYVLALQRLSCVSFAFDRREDDLTQKESFADS